MSPYKRSPDVLFNFIRMAGFLFVCFFLFVCLFVIYFQLWMFFQSPSKRIDIHLYGSFLLGVFYSDYCLWTMCLKNCRTGRYCSVCVTDIMASVWIADQRIMNIKYQLIFNMNIFVRHEYFDGWLIDREAWLFVINTHTQIDPNRRGKKNSSYKESTVCETWTLTFSHQNDCNRIA